MTFVKGQSGNPGGRNSTEKIWRDAIRKAVLALEADGKTKKIESCAAAMVKATIEGDVAAANHVADRLDGKVPQALVGDADHPPLLPNGIAMIPVPPDAK